MNKYGRTSFGTPNQLKNNDFIDFKYMNVRFRSATLYSQYNSSSGP